MNNVRKRITLFVVLVACMVAITGVYSEDLVDNIVAVVGNEVILLSELEQQMHGAMMERNLSMDSPREQILALRGEIMNGMIEDLLILMEAKSDTTIVIDQQDVDFDLNQAIEGLKAEFGGEVQYRQSLAEYGFTELQMRQRHRMMIEKNMLKENVLARMRRHISVTPQEMEQWIEANGDSIPELPAQFKISHILLYPQVSEARKQEVRDTLTDIRERALGGEDFAELAKSYSQDSANAPDGGDLGYFERGSGFIKEFVDAAFALDEGEISGVVETVFGYHLIKCDDIMGDRISARHILLLLQADENDEQVIIDRLNEYRESIVSGDATFDALARQHSDDENSSELGGVLDWLNADTGLKSFLEQAASMGRGDLSEPFKSEYGWHIIKLDDVKQAHKLNIRDDRTILENLIGQQKLITEYTRVINDLREKTYIDIRIN
jgi:peptidyl-prolyl cis-trans isomerase SurA